MCVEIVGLLPRKPLHILVPASIFENDAGNRDVRNGTNGTYYTYFDFEPSCENARGRGIVRANYLLALLLPIQFPTSRKSIFQSSRLERAAGNAPVLVLADYSQLTFNIFLVFASRQICLLLHFIAGAAEFSLFSSFVLEAYVQLTLWNGAGHTRASPCERESSFSPPPRSVRTFDTFLPTRIYLITPGFQLLLR